MIDITISKHSNFKVASKENKTDLSIPGYSYLKGASQIYKCIEAKLRDILRKKLHCVEVK